MSYTSEIKYLVKHAPWPVLSQIVRLLTGFVISVSFARLYWPEIYGQYQFVLSVISLFSVFSLGGLHLVVMKAIIDGRERSLIRGVKISFLGSLIAVPLIFAVGIWQFLQENAAVGTSLFISALIFPALYSTNTWSAYFDALKQFKATSIRISFLNVALAAALFFAAWQQFSLPILVATYCLINSLFHLQFYISVIRRLRTSSAWLDTKLGVKITAQKFAQSLTASLPALLMAFFYNYQEVAVFSVFFSSLRSLIPSP